MKRITPPLLVESPTHRTLTGEMVPFGCETCVSDLGARIADAIYRRDSMVGRTDGREHYNGILKVLRREKRAAIKEAEKHVVMEAAVRLIVRNLLKEQVVGYSPPAKSSDDDPGYETIGDTSVAASPTDEDEAHKQGSQLSLADKSDLRAQMGDLQNQRVTALKKGDAVSATHLGVQLQRLQDVLG